MARRQLVRRLNLDLPPDEKPHYDPRTVDGLVDWICDVERLGEQDERITEAVQRLRRRSDD